MDEHAPSERELQAMEGRCDAATAERLAVINQGRGRVALCLARETDDKIVLCAKFYGPDRVGNANLAAHAVHDLRQLVQEVRRLRALLEAHGISWEHRAGKPARKPSVD